MTSKFFELETLLRLLPFLKLNCTIDFSIERFFPMKYVQWTFYILFVLLKYVYKMFSLAYGWTYLTDYCIVE